MKSTKCFVFACGLLVIVMASCKSTPKITETPEAGQEVSKEDTSVQDAQAYENLGELLAAAQDERAEILDNGFDQNDPDSFTIADNAFDRALKVYEAGASKPNKKAGNDAMQDASEALNGFRIILDSGWMGKISVVRKASADAQQVALRQKADVAVRDGYNRAAELHNKGNGSYKLRDWKTSYNYFLEAKPVFEATAQAAMEKRRVAELALKNAEKKI
ncbi:MAG: hypothetical protein LBV52_06960, partial [Spirochaetaceae bacterium]|nr:hypothetical protein [Spirochaetaceae bacterium]